jgi:hypothetical protein
MFDPLSLYSVESPIFWIFLHPDCPRWKRQHYILVSGNIWWKTLNFYCFFYYRSIHFSWDNYHDLTYSPKPKANEEIQSLTCEYIIYMYKRDEIGWKTKNTTPSKQLTLLENDKTGKVDNLDIQNVTCHYIINQCIAQFYIHLTNKVLY